KGLGTWCTFCAVIAGLLLPTLILHKKYPHRAKTVWGTFSLVALLTSIPFLIVSISLGSSDRWRPPKLPHNAPAIVIHLGGADFAYPVKDLDKFKLRFLNIGGDELPMFKPFIKNGRLYIKTKLFGNGIEAPFMIDDQSDQPTALGWDRNY